MVNLNDLPDLEILKGKESELNWEARDRLLTSLSTFFNEQRTQLDYSLAGMSTFSGSFADLRASYQTLPANDARFIISGWIKNYFDDILLILHTPRTQLSIRTCHFIGSFALFLGPGLFDSFAESSLNHLIKLCGTTKKIISNSAADVAKNISTFILPQRAFPVLLNGAIDKNVNCRLRSFECLKIISERNYEESNGAIYQKIWENAVEKVLQKGIGDANAEIRSVSMNIFLIFKEKTPELTTKFMDKLDPSTKKQLGLLLAKISPSSTTPKGTKPSIISSIPLAQIRKTLLKDRSSMESSPISPSKSPNRSLSPSPSKSLSPSKSVSELRNEPLKSPKKTLTPISKLTPKSKSLNDVTDVPMDEISIVPNSPTKNGAQYQELIETEPPGSPMKVDRVEHIKAENSCSDVFMDARSEDNLSDRPDSDEEIILNVVNVIRSSLPSTPNNQETFNSMSHKQKLQHSVSSPSIPTRIKSLGLAAGTPLRAIFRNASETELNMNRQTYPLYVNSNSSLLNDLIEEFCNTRDKECFKKILSLRGTRESGDFDGLTSSLVQKLFKSAASEIEIEMKMKLLKNFLKTEPFLLSHSGREIIEILEEDHNCSSNSDFQVVKIICQSNLTSILMDKCIEMCCERLSEFKLILLAEFIKNCVVNVQEMITKCITPLLLALNHPNLNIRRLSINCFLEIRNKFDGSTEKVLQLLDDGRVGLIQRRIIEGFLRQF